MSDHEPPEEYKVGILLVHGIGHQRPGTLVKTWGRAIEEEYIRLIASAKPTRNLRVQPPIFDEYLWEPEAKAFSGLIVTTWALLNLPRIVGIHAALYSQAIRSRAKPSSSGTAFNGAFAMMRNAVLRGVMLPAVATPLIVALWVINPPIVLLSGLLSLVFKQRWRPFRPANLIMAQTIGDAYVWLANPIGRLFSRGSHSELTDGLLEKVESLWKQGVAGSRGGRNAAGRNGWVIVSERGARSEERGARSEERGARSEERGARSEERGGGGRARSEERGARSEERGARSEERGARSGRTVRRRSSGVRSGGVSFPPDRGGFVMPCRGCGGRCPVRTARVGPCRWWSGGVGGCRTRTPSP